MDPMEDRSEIAFFDLETTYPTRPRQGRAILEFGAILVCPKKLVELKSYSFFVRPSDLSLISSLSARSNGITRDAVLSAHTFLEFSDEVYDILHGRIWAGHNILRFDCARIREAFAEIGKTAPEPKGIIDSLALLTRNFGRRAGDMKMASLANYFGLGQQRHRSLADVRLNLEVLRYCATVLFLESSLPDIFTTNSGVSSNATTSSNAAQPDFFDLGPLINEINTESLQPDVTMEDNPVLAPEMSSTADVPQGFSNSAGFLDPDEVSISSISASLVLFYRGIRKIKILHKDVMLQLCSTHLTVRFGISTRFVDPAGRPWLNFVVDASPSLCQVLDACDDLASKLSMDSGSSSEWRPVVIRKHDYLNSSTVRLIIPTVVNGEVAMYSTEIYQKESSSAVQRLVFSRTDGAELKALFIPGTRVDAYLSLDPYDYQQSAGIRLVAKKLIIHSI